MIRYGSLWRHSQLMREKASPREGEGANKTSQSVAILRSNPVAPDPRVEKVALTLSRYGWRVTIVGWDRTASLQSGELATGVTIERIPIRAAFGQGMGNLLPELRWQVQLWLWLWRNRRNYTHIHACDFDTVLPAFFMQRVFGKKLVYDIFDFAADSFNVPSWLSRLIRRLDLWIINRVDTVVLADERRREQIEGSTPRRLEVIYNSPMRVGKPARATDWNGLAIAYVGILGEGRSLRQMLDVVASRPDWRLEIAGFGPLEDLIRGKSEEFPNIIFHGRVDYETALAINARAHVMFAIYDPSVKNHKYSSPNKLFEAMMLGKPIIVARGTGVDELVQRHELGFVVTYGDKTELLAALSAVAAWTPETRDAFATRVQRLFESSYSWDVMEKRLLAIYDTWLQTDEA